MSEKKRILLIDNEAGLCRMMEQVLLDHGYLAKANTSPQKAVAEFRPGALGPGDHRHQDARYERPGGIEKIKEISREIPVIMSHRLRHGGDVHPGAEKRRL